MLQVYADLKSRVKMGMNLVPKVQNTSCNRKSSFERSTILITQPNSATVRTPSYMAPRCTDFADTCFLGGPKFFQVHGFPNVGHSFTLQLHGFELGPIIKPRYTVLRYTVYFLPN